MKVDNEVLIIVPAYNEDQCIAAVLNDLKKFGFTNILVVNDASTDATECVAIENGAKVISLPFNLHTGGAFKAGLEYAARYCPGIPVVQFDGDGQHKAEQIERILAPLDEDADIVIGSRFLGSEGYRSEKTRRFGIKVFSALVSLITEERFTDITSGFRAISPKAVTKLQYAYPADYPDAGALVLAHKLNLSIREISVDMRPRKTGRSYFRHMRSLLYPPRTIMSILAGAFAKGERNV